MTSEATLQYLTQVICERMKDKKEPRFPVIEELFTFIKKHEEVTMDELRECLNELHKEKKIVARSTLNSKLIELI